ncbi:FecCD family ABC transporter permease [Cohnella sp. JJ-181]|uniref:FecCD family ABC transporter permease n=1 Tax=Cohnella rhizoplanae TaxID=2974897 RepID=UPI0022FF7FB3|nr:iron ABC transporter permease [Cohnella sp. JJ-181]CAI6085279.1 Iron-uptake system permease protein FeuC [Cohnella sp. JJ-181]
MTDTRSLRKQQIIVVSLVALTLLTIVVSLGLGSSSVSYGRIIPTILGHGSFKEKFVLFDLRLPRICIVAVAGMALALSGSILQGITNNDLADPGILGINSGAGIGVAISFLLIPAEPGSFVYVIPVSAFLGAMATAALLYAFSYDRQSGLHPMRLVLVGIGFSLAFSGLMVFITSAVDIYKVDFISRWLAGNVWGTDWTFLWAQLPWLVVLLPYTLYKSNTLNLLSLNDATAIGTGVPIARERVGLLVASVALAASAVAVTGGIAFIGLMAPHIAKSLVGPRYQRFVPVAVLTGGFLLLLADTIGRNLGNSQGVAAGIVVSFIGAPYFVYLLLRRV